MENKDYNYDNGWYGTYHNVTVKSQTMELVMTVKYFNSIIKVNGVKDTKVIGK